MDEEDKGPVVVVFGLIFTAIVVTALIYCCCKSRCFTRPVCARKVAKKSPITAKDQTAADAEQQKPANQIKLKESQDSTASPSSLPFDQDGVILHDPDMEQHAIDGDSGADFDDSQVELDGYLKPEMEALPQH